MLPLVDRPDGAALFLRPNAATPAATVTIIDRDCFLADAHALAAALPPCRHVLDLCRDRYAFTVAFAACLIAGRVCLLPPDATAATIAALRATFPDTILITDTDLPPAGTGGPNTAIPADQLAAIAFTSGSTGHPVAHPKTWGALVARSRAAGTRFALDERTPASIVGTVPANHMYGFETTALLPLHAACASWCGPAFFPADITAALTHSPTPRILVTTPLQLRALQNIPVPTLHAIISATAPLDPALAADTEARWHASVFEIFGATEVGSIASRRTTDGDWWRPYPGVTLGQDEFSAWAEADTMARTPLADDLDIAANEVFRLLGRRTDLIKLGGRRASLAGLNRILTGLDGVHDGTFVVPDDLEHPDLASQLAQQPARLTARLLAIVVAPDRSVPSILADLRARMEPVFLPRRVIHVDALPRNHIGKLARQSLLDLVTRADGTRIDRA